MFVHSNLNTTFFILMAIVVFIIVMVIVFNQAITNTVSRFMSWRFHRKQQRSIARMIRNMEPAAKEEVVYPRFLYTR